MKTKIIPLLERLLSLLVVALLVSATTLWSSERFSTDATVAEQAANTPLSGAVKERLGLTEAVATPVDSVTWNIVRDGRAAGTVVYSRPLAPKGKGFAGPTPLYLYVGADGRIAALASGENSETADFYRSAEKGLFATYRGMTPAEAVAAQPDAVTGATYSSRGITAHVRAAANYLVDAPPAAVDAEAPIAGWGRTAAALAMVLLSAVVAVRYRGIKWLRLVTLSLNVIVLGLWTGQYLSLSLVRSLASGGWSLLSVLPAVAVLSVALLLPFFGRRHHYCSWVCPFGSLQELAYRLPGPKIRISARGFRLLGYVRTGFLFLLLFLLWNGLGEQVVAHEPLAALQWNSAPTDVILIAGVIVVLGVFVPQPWCRTLCPMGCLLSLAEDSGVKRVAKKNAK